MVDELATGASYEHQYLGSVTLTRIVAEYSQAEISYDVPLANIGGTKQPVKEYVEMVDEDGEDHSESFGAFLANVGVDPFSTW